MMLMIHMKPTDDQLDERSLGQAGVAMAVHPIQDNDDVGTRIRDNLSDSLFSAIGHGHHTNHCHDLNDDLPRCQTLLSKQVGAKRLTGGEDVVQQNREVGSSAERSFRNPL